MIHPSITMDLLSNISETPSSPVTDHSEATVWNLTESELRLAHYNNIVYYSTMVPLAVAGNIFTITAVIMVLKIKTNIPNLLIGVLACTDIFSILTCHLIAMASMARGEYIGSDAVCRFQSMMAYTYFKMGFLTKCCISLDRFIALAFPLKYRRLVTMKRVIMVIANNIVFSFGTSGLTLILDKEYIHLLPTWYMCVNDFHYYTVYKFIIVVSEGAIFTLGVILFFVSNITVIKVVLKLNKRTHYKLGKVASVDPLPTYKTDSTIPVSNNNDLHLSVKSFKSSEVHAEHPDSNFQQATSKIKNNSSHDSKTNPVLIDRSSTPTASENGSIDSIESSHQKSDKPSSIKTNASRQKRQQKELQLAKLVTIIVSVFVLLWLPYMVSVYCRFQLFWLVWQNLGMAKPVRYMYFIPGTYCVPICIMTVSRNSCIFL